jgi:transposase
MPGVKGETIGFDLDHWISRKAQSIWISGNDPLSTKKRKTCSQEFNLEAVRLIIEKGYSIAEPSRNLGVEYSVLRHWKKQLADDPQNAFPGKRAVQRH